MKRYLAFLSLFTVLLLGGAGAAALQQDTSATQSTSKPASGSKSNSQSQKTGEEVFEANCVRCHRPPMSISPRITGTIIMHMRVRARLSRQDEQQLLKYMAP